MLKKTFSSLFVMLISVLLVIGLTGCGSNDTSTNASEPTPAAEPVAPVEPEVITVVEECDEAKVIRDKAFEFFVAAGVDWNQWAPADFANQFDLARDSVFVLDVRRPADFAEGHLEGAVNASFPEGRVAGVIDDLPKDKDIAVICYTGQTAGQTVGALRMMGYKAKVITGGFNNGIKPHIKPDGDGLFELVTP